MTCPNCKHAQMASPSAVRCLANVAPTATVSAGYCLKICTHRQPEGDGDYVEACGNCYSRQHSTDACPIPPDHTTEAESKRRNCCDPVK